MGQLRIQCRVCLEWFDHEKQKKRVCSEECEVIEKKREEERNSLCQRLEEQDKAHRSFLAEKRKASRLNRKVVPNPPRLRKLKGKKRKHLREQIRKLEQEVYRLKIKKPGKAVPLSEIKKSWGFYGTEAWTKVRYQALKEYGRVCMLCQKSGKGVVIDVDHIKPRSKFPELALVLSNLQILCRQCNQGKSNIDSTDWRSF